MGTQPKKVVNTQDQNSSVNPPDSDNLPARQDDNTAPRENVSADNPATYEQGSSHDLNTTSAPIEGDDAGDPDGRNSAI